MNEYTFDAADRAAFERWLAKIPPNGPEEALFEAMSLKMRHDLATVYMILIDLRAQQAQTDQHITALQGEMHELVTGIQSVTSEFAAATQTMHHALIRLDQGITIIEALHQHDMGDAHGDTRPVYDRLRTLEATQLRLVVALILVVVIFAGLLSLAAA